MLLIVSFELVFVFQVCIASLFIWTDIINCYRWSIRWFFVQVLQCCNHGLMTVVWLILRLQSLYSIVSSQHVLGVHWFCYTALFLNFHVTCPWLFRQSRVNVRFLIISRQFPIDCGSNFFMRCDVDWSNFLISQVVVLWLSTRVIVFPLQRCRYNNWRVLLVSFKLVEPHNFCIHEYTLFRLEYLCVLSCYRITDLICVIFIINGSIHVSWI